ncbi:MAG: fatty-acyl-CoA synthase [Candidatus Eremiobacteraeota bacterium]|nr:fatty-acyl-CoA synthase [Candidatus Eremiobacteraeota bacterium]
MALPSYAHGASPVPLLGETIGDNLDRIARRFPDGDAVVSVHQNRRLTYAQFTAETDRLAKAFLAAGVEHGERVGIWSPNSLEWVLVQYASAKIGAVLVNVNPAYRLSELEYALRQSGVSTLIVLDRYKTSEYLAMVREVRGSLPALREVVIIGESEPDDGETGWDDYVACAGEVDETALAERKARCQFDEPINIQYTSGTTGFPKGATLSHHNILNNGFFIGEGCRYTNADRVCVPVPFYHCFGMVLGNLAITTHGAAIVIPNWTFDPALTLEAVVKEKCTSLYGVPTMFIAELALPDFTDYDLSTLRTGIMAGSPCPVEVMKRVQSEMHMPEVTICYGMTETSPVSTQTMTDDPLEKRTGTVGRVHPHIEVKIVDGDGRILPRNTPGELCTRGYSVMLGYWENAEATALAIDAARYMHTGDIAVMDDDGYVNISGRIKDMVIRGGENVYPREIEEFLYTHPAIKDVQVIGVPDERYGEELCAWVIVHDGAALGEDDVREYCRGKIAHYKIPRYVMFVDGWPMTVSGKVQKYKMREESIQKLGLENAAKIVTA